MMKRVHYILYILLTGIIFFLFLDPLAHVITYQEQHTLFLFSGSYLKPFFEEAGMPVKALASFLIQFFYLYYPGRLLFAFILSGSYLSGIFLTRRLTGNYDLLSLALLPVCYLIIQYESVDFPVWYATGFLVSSLLLIPFLFLSAKYKILYMLIYIPVTGYMAGWYFPLLAVLAILLPCLSALYLTKLFRKQGSRIVIFIFSLLLWTGGTGYFFCSAL